MFHGLQPTVVTERGSVRVYNPTAHDVTTILTTNLALPKGAYRGGGVWRAIGATAVAEFVQHEKFGAGWRDGSNLQVEMPGYDSVPLGHSIPGAAGESWRMARIHFRCDIPKNSEKVVTIEEAQVSAPDFALHADVLAALTVGYPWFRLRVGADELDLLRQPGLIVESGPLIQVARYRGRVPNTPFWAELEVQFHLLQRHARFWFWYGNSWIDSPVYTDVHYTLPGHVELFVRAARVWLRHESNKQQSKTLSGIDTTIRLIDQAEAGGFFPDGASQMLTGVIQFGADPLPTDVSADAQTWRAMQTRDPGIVGATWRAAKAFGPFGHVVERPPWIPDDATFRARAITRADRDYADAVASGGGPWAWAQYGCLPHAGASGAQEDFGATRYMGIAASAHPAGLLAAQRSAYQEACRPIWFRFADASPWDIVAKPTFMWNERPEWRDQSADNFGKVRRDIDNSRSPWARNNRNIWWQTGLDLEHYTFNHWLFYAQLTGDRGAMNMCRARCEHWRALHTYPGSPGSNGSTRNNPMGATRGRGRGMHAGAQLALVTGRDDFWIHVRERFTQRELTIWDGAGNSHPWIGFTARGFLNPSRIDHYRVWEELQASGLGYGSIFALFAIAQARIDGLRVTKSMLLNAFQDRSPTSQWQRYRVWPGAAWSAPGTPPSGTVVTCGAGIGRLHFQYLPAQSYDGFVQLYECTGTWGNGAPIVAATGAQLDWGGDIRFRLDLTTLANLAASANGNQFHTLAQRLEIDPTPINPDSPLLHFHWDGITQVWSLSAVLLAREWAQQLGDAAAEAAAQAVLDNWLPARGDPGDGYLDEGQAGWSQWAGVVADPWV